MADQSDKDIIAEARLRFTRCQAHESLARDNALADTRFANGDAYNNWQWPNDVRSNRGDRPCLTQNKIRQHNLHIVNDARQHKAAIKVTPTGGGATFEAAQVFSAIIRRIEYQSKAMDAYSTAIYHQVESGIGYVRVVTDYADDDSFDQEIFIRRVKDPRTVFLDPDAQEYDKGDMRFAFCFIDTPRKEFEAKYPDAKADEGPSLDYSDDWDSKEHVREAEYWRRGEKTDTLHLLTDGSTVRESALPAGAKARLPIVKSRDVAEASIEWFQLAGGKIVDRKVWPGRYIPIVPFIGEEITVDGQMDRKGHTRALIDAQRMYNYWNSAAVEQVALQGKSPYIAPSRAIEGVETYWNTANTVNHPYLPYNDMDDSGQPIAKPERSVPPQMAQAYLQGMATSREDMMMVSGQYQAEMGAPGNERSGVAIQQRQREGDTATYHYIDNQAKGIRQVGRICLDLIPKIYDVARVIKIMAADGTQSDVDLDPRAQQAHQHVMPGAPGQPAVPVSPEQAQQAQEDPAQPDPRVIFNPAVGRYDVEADVGPPFGTQREEAYNAISQIIQASPDLVHVAGDLLFKSADFPLADELAERLKRGVPPQFMGGPSPQVLQLQQQVQQTTQHGQAIAQQADAEVARLKAEIATLREQAKDKSAGASIDDYRAETERLKAVAAADPAAAQGADPLDAVRSARNAGAAGDAGAPGGRCGARAGYRATSFACSVAGATGDERASGTRCAERASGTTSADGAMMATLDTATRILIDGDKAIRLTRHQCIILQALAPGLLVQVSTFIARIYADADDEPDWPERVLRVRICQIRRCFREAGIDLAIKSDWSGGYILSRPIGTSDPGAVLPAADVQALQSLLYSHPDQAAADRVLARLVGG